MFSLRCVQALFSTELRAGTGKLKVSDKSSQEERRPVNSYESFTGELVLGIYGTGHGDTFSAGAQKRPLRYVAIGTAALRGGQQFASLQLRKAEVLH